MSRPFNLAEALAGAACETADGRKVRKIVDMECEGKLTLAVAIEGSIGFYSYSKEGLFSPYATNYGVWDLRMASTKRVFWANFALDGAVNSFRHEETARSAAYPPNRYEAIAFRVEVEV